MPCVTKPFKKKKVASGYIVRSGYTKFEIHLQTPGTKPYITIIVRDEERMFLENVDA